MDNYVKSVKLGEFNKEHLEILLGCLYLPLYVKNHYYFKSEFYRIKTHKHGLRYMKV